MINIHSAQLLKKLVLKDYIDSYNKENLLLITNLTDKIIIYNFACAGHGGTIQNDYIAREYNTRAMSSVD